MARAFGYILSFVCATLCNKIMTEKFLAYLVWGKRKQLIISIYEHMITGWRSVP